MSKLKDIAQLTKVSVSTVSKVLNGKGRVSEKKRKEILRVARQLGYTPNYHARSMARKTKILTVGLIVPEIINPFFASLTRGVQKACGEDALVILMDSFRNLEREEKLIKNARFFGIDGIIIGNSRVSDDLVEEISGYIPVVVFDKFYELDNVVSIVLDNRYGAYMATRHLIENGCRNIVHLGGTHELYVSLERARGYEAAMNEVNLKPVVEPVGYNESAGYEAMKRLLDSGFQIDGVFCMNDLVAIGAIRALKEKSLRIPDDVAVVGFDDDEELCEIIEPPLSSVHQPVEEMGEVAAKLLFELIKGNSKIKRYVFTPRLVVRRSSLKKVKS
ncbi:MAG: Periplasmic binding protein/LacI transcriptional regulator [Thermotoga sp. 50_1627]|uniref:LacI family DNA-binding transcriptional regulator n=1 Tax=Pseudothermotoga sp. TaxID=2033661 RepID=UPI00076CBDEE|nr:MAG: Periplasmic binding protein/LacI transcriptional regulator [Thermotoga sp. 50_64]KUK24453.1 MAG: Periplasmic binding protein/LacI transcriptional regulator [Thermotoga sp. 50_1627]MBC7117115.1 LacI family DNA-binding transcriptional regulator [Pseudothermotoga sp.]MBC7121643.1 LacI family DNA-binding transcriptional regulator [Pseudothermotoga sp.]MDK2922942.1 LacI family transcriptional regulator [Pseudothermotoga sp.]